MDNATRRELLEKAKQIGYPGDILSVFHNPQILDQYEQQLQSQPQQQTEQQQPQPVQQQFQPQAIVVPPSPAPSPRIKATHVNNSQAKPLVSSFNKTAPQLMKDGGPKEMPFGLPLKEQNIYLVPEYNQPINPKTGEILPDMRRPNLGMDTGATEYKYTYGSDEGDIDVPSIVAGQYIGDQALDRYNLTGERFKTMSDPGSYSKFYNQMNQLGLMQEKKYGGIKFDDGGLKDPPAKKEPRVISNPEEFKIANQAYADSLSLYNKGVKDKRAYINLINNLGFDHNAVYERDTYLGEYNDFNNPIRWGSVKPIAIMGDLHTYENTNNRTVGTIDKKANRILEAGYDIYKKPTQPVVFEPPLERIEPKPITKLPVLEPQLQPVNLNVSKTKTFDSYNSNYTQRSGQLKQGTYYYDKDLKRWQYKPAEQEEIDYEKKKGKVKKYGGKKCYTCNSSKMKVLYNKANYKK
jgi:hypothetical protein